MLRLPLASLGDETCVGRLTARVFGLLKKFGGGGATDSSRGEHRDLVVTASQLLVLLIRDVKTSRLEEEQLRQVNSWREFFVNKNHKQLLSPCVIKVLKIKSVPYCAESMGKVKDLVKFW
jgi:hypothetical protein